MCTGGVQFGRAEYKTHHIISFGEGGMKLMLITTIVGREYETESAV